MSCKPSSGLKEIRQKMEIKKIAVIGCGAMGSGIAYTAARFGYHVSVVEINQELLDNGMNKIRNDIRYGIDRGKLELKDAEALFSRLKPTTDLQSAVSNVDLVIEAIIEKMDVKKELFAKLEEYSPKLAILASNTSSLSIADIASATHRPEKCIGMHFFNPVPAMKLLELVITDQTSDQTVEVAEQVGKQLEKITVRAKDTPGFIVNRILAPVFGESMTLLDEGIATPEEIDKACVRFLGWPVGPLFLADFAGLDIALGVGTYLSETLGPCYTPSPLLTKLVEAGKLGNKQGGGFTEHYATIEKSSKAAEYTPELLVHRIVIRALSEAARLMDIGVTLEDIDLACRYGLNWQKGPSELIAELGAADLLEMGRKLFEEKQSECYQMPATLEQMLR